MTRGGVTSSGRFAASSSVRRGLVLATVALTLAACARSAPEQPRASYATPRPDPVLGTSPSPRVVEGGQRVPRGGGVYKIGTPYQVAGLWYYPREQPRLDETGIASWYGTEFHGRKTANGEIYDMHALTAAHPTLPLPSLVAVTNLANGRTLLVRVNDRGPFARGRVIDLSNRVARELGLEHQGTGEVRVRYVGRAPLDGDDSRERRHLASQSWYRPRYGAAPAHTGSALRRVAGWEAELLSGGRLEDESSLAPRAADGWQTILARESHDGWQPAAPRAPLATPPPPAPPSRTPLSPWQTGVQRHQAAEPAVAGWQVAPPPRPALSDWQTVTAPPSSSPIPAEVPVAGPQPAETPRGRGGSTFIEIGVFGDPAAVSWLARDWDVRRGRGTARVDEVVDGGGRQWRLVVGPFTADEAAETLQRIHASGLQGAQIVSR